MNYLIKNAATPGTSPEVTCRYMRLNYFSVARAALGPTIMVRPNILLVLLGGLWRKLHEGEVIDLGEIKTFSFGYDWFANAYPGQPDSPPEFEVEMSNNPLADLRTVGSTMFVDGVSLALGSGNVQTITDPPNVVYTSHHAQTARAPLRRLAINNFSGGSLLLGNRYGALVTEIKTGTRFAENLRGQVMISNATGGTLTFYYEFYFEWV